MRSDIAWILVSKFTLCSPAPSRLRQSGTSEPGAYSYFYNGRAIRLIDTPGFDDTNRTDTDILKDIAFFLSTIYSKKVKLAGIIYLHRITDVRMTGSSYKNLRMLEKLCGDGALPKVVLATTMWNLLGKPGSEHTTEVGEQREAMLKDKFWGNMERKGSFVTRHYGDADSGRKIVSYLIEHESNTVLDIQREMVDEGLSLDKTAAGQFLQADQIKIREKYERDLREAQESLEEALKEKDKALIAQYTQESAEYESKLMKANADTSALSMSFKGLVEEKDAQYATLAKQMEAERKSRTDEMRFIEQNLSELQDSLERQERDHREEMRRMMRSQSAKTAAEVARMQQIAEQYKQQHAEMIRQIAEMEEEKRRKAARDRNNIFKSAFWVSLLSAEDSYEGFPRPPQYSGGRQRQLNYHGGGRPHNERQGYY